MSKSLHPYIIILIILALPHTNNSATLTFEGQSSFTESWSENGINWNVETVSDIRGYIANNGSLHLYVQRSDEYLEADHFFSISSLYIYVDDIEDDNSYVDFIGYDDNDNVVKTQRFTPSLFVFEYELVSLSGFTNIAKLEIEFDGTVAPFIDDIQYTDNGPLPVELTSFEGYNTEEGVVLKWETATEVNNFGFDVEREKGGSGEWEKVGFVQGNGTTNSPKNYEFTDSELPDADEVSYRLKQIDNDGTFVYSKIVTVDLTTITSVDDEIEYEFALEQNYPNPFNPSTTIKFTVPNVVDAYYAPPTKLIVYDVLGREVATLLNKDLKPGNHEVAFDASKLSSGMYFYRIDVGNEFSSIKKMILVK